MGRVGWLMVGLFCTVSMAFGQLGSTLNLGSHKVGFEQKWLFDYGRTYKMKLPNGSFYGSKKSPRPILLNLWYPALPSKRTKPMPHSRYLDFAKANPEIKPWLTEYATYNRDTICNEVTGTSRKKLTAGQTEAWKKFLEHPTRCFLDAKPSTGKFPLVIYHPGYGSSVEDNAEFCEFLASYGYMVASSSYVDRDGDSFNIDAYSGSIGDINFLTTYLRQRPNVDWEHIGLIGHSGGAHTALKSRAVFGVAADAIVSLDTTEDYYSLDDPRWKFVQHDILPNLFRMKGPILMVANPYAYFALADKFKEADRHYFTVALGHNEFISQGVQRLRVMEPFAELTKKSETTKERKRVEDCYRRLCEFTLGYFDANLKGNRRTLAQLEKTYSTTVVGGTLPHVEVVPKGTTTIPDFDPEKPGIPTPRQVRPLLAKIGPEKVAEIIRSKYEKSNPAPIFNPVFAYALEFELFKQNKGKDAEILHAAYSSVKVKTAQMFTTQAWFGDVTKNYAFAEECLKMLLTLEPEHGEGKKMLEDIQKKMKGS